MQDFHDQIGLAEEEPCFFMVNLPESDEGFFNYIVGSDFDEKSYLEAVDVFFCDGESDECESINGGPLLYSAILRDFLNGEMLICGLIMIDQKGRMWIRGSYSDDIGVDLRVTVSLDSLGYSFYSTDMRHTMRMWRDEEHFYCAPTSIFYTSGLPS